MSPPPCPCSEKELAGLCEVLYNDSLLLLKQAALYVLGEEEAERDEPPGEYSVGRWEAINIRQ